MTNTNKTKQSDGDELGGLYVTYIELRQGDFRKSLNIKPGTVDLVLADLPYGNLFKHTRKKFKGFVVNGDDLDFLPDMFDGASRWMKPGAPLVLFCDHKGFSRFEQQGKAQGFNLINVGIWDKQNFGIGYNFRPMHELLMLFSTGKSIMAQHRNLPSILRCPRVNNKVHPTQKPVPLLARLIDNFCPLVDWWLTLAWVAAARQSPARKPGGRS